jgi:hypothetical protein
MMPGVHFEEVWKAIRTAFTKKTLKQMLRTRLTKDLDEIAEDGSVTEMAFDLLTAAEREGWMIDLIREAYQFNPRNGDLEKVHQKYGLAPGLSVQNSGAEDPKVKVISSGGFTRAIRDRLPQLDINVWREKLAQVEGRVCRVEIGGNTAGTGFLVGPDAVLTAYHLLEDVLNGRIAADKVTCRFDYKELADCSRLEGTVVGLHPTDWKLDFSPYSAAEASSTPDNPPPTPEELDYALVRLARRLGEEPASPRGGAEAPRRGWLTLNSTAPVFVPTRPLMIAHHPEGRPLKLTVDTKSVIGVNANRTRVRYLINTEPGSGGSPVFDLEWNLVAMHHFSDPSYEHPKTYKQGIPIDLIQKRIVAQGKADALGGESP